MHSYLRAVGFSEIKKRRQIEEIIQDVIETYDEKNIIEDYEDGVFAEFSKNYGCDCGITVCGQYDEKNEFHVEYYFPFFRGTGITTDENVVIERHAAQQSFAGACDDLRIGVTLIFYLQNVAEYMLENQRGLHLRGGRFLQSPDLQRKEWFSFLCKRIKKLRGQSASWQRTGAI